MILKIHLNASKTAIGTIAIILMPIAVFAQAMGINTTVQPPQYCLCNTFNDKAINLVHKRLALVVLAYKPAKPDTGLIISLLSNDKIQKQTIAQISVYPSLAFSASDTDKQQQFLLSLTPYAQLLTNVTPLCFALEFDARQIKPIGGFVEFYIKWLD